MNTLSPQDISEEISQPLQTQTFSQTNVTNLPSVLDLIRQVFAFVQAHFTGILSIFGVYIAGLLIPACVVGLIGFSLWNSQMLVSEVLPLLFAVGGAIFLLAYIIWSAVMGNAFAYFVVNNGFVENGVRGTFRAGLRLLIPGAWVSFLIMVPIFGGFMLFALPGIFLLVVFLCAYSVFLVEGKRGVAALAQSWYYVKGKWWSVFLLLAVWFLITWIVLSVVGMSIGFITSLFFGSKIGPIVQEVVTGILNFMVYGLAWIYYYHIYVALRALKPEPMTEDVERTMRRKVYAAFVIGVFGIIVFISLVIFLVSIAANIH